ncbi:hypothetical protein DV517_55720 [Streptomyces sp. S816]|nr:hypothetical protein [Streptomyces sp. S816]TGZ14089.1 hypothetical protein DV517_55720 [Streptomyces sp. S816]
MPRPLVMLVVRSELVGGIRVRPHAGRLRQEAQEVVLAWKIHDVAIV